MSERMVNLHLYHEEDGKELDLTLPAGTKLEALTDILYKNNIVRPQRIGYGYIAKGHLCNNYFTLADYLPEGEDSLALRIFDHPQVL